MKERESHLRMAPGSSARKGNESVCPITMVVPFNSAWDQPGSCGSLGLVHYNSAREIDGLLKALDRMP